MGLSIRKDFVAVDVPEHDNLSSAIKRFCYLWKHCGLHRELRFREENPSRSERRRAKQLKVLRRHRRQMAMTNT